MLPQISALGEILKDIPTRLRWADMVFAPFAQAEAAILANPAAINERFRIAVMRKARTGD
ncbi:hypothetical protein ACFIOY_18135 [Bradyrhizobium sp. TZ2]